MHKRIDTPLFAQIQVRQFQNHVILKSKKDKILPFLKTHRIFSCRNEMQQRRKWRKKYEYQWAITEAARRQYCSLLASNVLQLVVPVPSLACTYVIDRMYTQFQLVQNSNSAGSSGTQQLRKIGKVYIFISVVFKSFTILVWILIVGKGSNLW